MKTVLVPLVLVLLATAALADSADLRVAVELSPNAPGAGETLFVRTSVTNDGPDTARNVWVSVQLDGIALREIDGLPPPEPKRPCPAGRCFVGDIPPGATAGIPDFVEALAVDDYNLVVRVNATSDTPDPVPANNVFRRSLLIKTLPKLRASLTLPAFADPGLPLAMTLNVFNDGTAAAHDVVVTVELPDGVTVLATTCATSPGRVDCTIPALANNPGVALKFPLTLKAPPRYEGGELSFRVTARAGDVRDTAQSTAKTTLYRTFLVTGTADRGAGSLRQAIDGANAACASARCAIQFNVPGGAAWQTIRLRSPLPPVRGINLRIDGATQAAFSGVANPDGPSIEISGGYDVAAGLDIDGLGIQEIANLAVNGFRGDGIRLSFDRIQNFTQASSIHHNYIGTDPTGTVAVPNRRGIALFESAPRVFPATAINNNLISGNSRTGLLAAGGGIVVRDNRVGVAARDDAALPNGGSGMHFDRSEDRIEVVGNVIAFNGESGIAVHPEARYFNAQGNRIWGNGGLPIDDGLDGPSPSVLTEDGPLPNPSVTSATYDAAAKSTTIRGTAPSGTVVAFYAAATAGEAERYLGATVVLRADGAFSVSVNADLRGQWIAATATRRFLGPFPEAFTLGRTSELGAGIEAR